MNYKCPHHVYCNRGKRAAEPLYCEIEGIWCNNLHSLFSLVWCWDKSAVFYHPCLVHKAPIGMHNTGEEAWLTWCMHSLLLHTSTLLEHICIIMVTLAHTKSVGLTLSMSIVKCKIVSTWAIGVQIQMASLLSVGYAFAVPLPNTCKVFQNQVWATSQRL